MLTLQTDSVSCLGLVLCQSTIVKCIFLFYLLLVFACFSTNISYLWWNKVVIKFQDNIWTTTMCPAMQYCDVRTNPRWRTAAILKIPKSPYPSQKSSDFDKIWYTTADIEPHDSHVTKNWNFERNFVWGSRTVCRRGLHDKNCKFLKSKMADGRHFESS